ncbi:MAG: hypothetical protein HRF49_08760 [bacterium]|jgi:hypothetical protein
MVKAYCNYCEIDLSASGVETFGDLVVYLTANVVPPGEVIYRLVVDGREIDETEEGKLAKEPLSGFELVETYTRNAVDISLEGLATACELVPSIREDALEAGGELRTGNMDRGYGLVADLIPFLGWYLDLLTAIDRIFVRPGDDFLTRDFAGMGAIRSFELLEAMKEQLAALSQAQQYRDHAAVADILEYEIAPILEVWETEVGLIQRRMAESRAAA